MATYFFLTGNTNDGANWSLSSGGSPAGAVPGNTDTAKFDSNSANANLVGTLNARITDFTGYTGTFSDGGGVLAFFEAITFDSGMTVSGSPVIAVTANSITATLTSNGFVWPGHVSESALSAGKTIIFADDAEVLGDWTTTQNVLVQGPGNITIHGDATLLFNNNSGATTKLIKKGDGSTLTGTLSLDVDFDSSGTIILGNSITFGGINKTFQIVSGVVDASNCDGHLNGGVTRTFDLQGTHFKSLDRISGSGGTGTVNLTSELSCGSFNHTIGNMTFNGSTFYVGGSFITDSGAINGTTQLVFNPTSGTHTFSTATGTRASGLKLDLTIDATGATYNLGNINYDGHLIYLGGTINPTGTLNITNNSTFDTDGVNLGTVRIWADNNTLGKVTLSSLLRTSKIIVDTFSTIQGFYGTAGFDTDELEYLTPSAGASDLILTVGNTYRVRDRFFYQKTANNQMYITSSSATDKAVFTVDEGATITITNSSSQLSVVTRIDSSGGQTIFTPKNFTLTDTINWNYRPSANFFAFFP